MKNLALFDFDHVIYNGQSFLDIVKYEIELERIIPAVEEEILTLLSKYKSEDLSYNQTLSGMLEVFCKSLKGIKYSDLLYDSINYFNSNPDSFFSYFNLILPDLKKTYDVYLITANTKFIAQAVVKKFVGR
ncbi:hypothetical protein GW755_01690 [bacterium]|nr:hypothetical protein [bacterium]